jgi:hypothetical protein
MNSAVLYELVQSPVTALSRNANGYHWRFNGEDLSTMYDD